MLDRIKEIVAGYMGIRVSDVNEETNFLDIGMDSLTLLKIVIDVENTFGIYIENDEIVEIRTILDILRLIEEKNFQQN
ncbi:MAG: acyl carrier protein [Clostridia bacterium]|nr:acyl carrier protein [Clostridia bacterium]